MEATQEIKDIVNNGIKAGRKKNDIVGDIYSVMGADANLSAAFSLYNELSKASGLLLDKEGREKLLIEVVTQYTVDDKVDRDKAINAYVERGRLSKSTALSHVREYCETNGIAFPINQRVKRDMEAVKTSIKAWHEANEPREAIIAGLKEHFQYSDNTAADAYRRIGKELGFIEPRTTENRENIAKWFKENGDGERKDVIKALAEKFGLTENTAAGYYSMYLFALTYCKLD